VCRILDRLFLTRPLPETLILDNGPEFAGTALDAWATQHGVQLHFIQPGKPVQNAFIESFNGKFRDREGSGNSDSVISGSLASSAPPRGGQ